MTYPAQASPAVLFVTHIKFAKGVRLDAGVTANQAVHGVNYSINVIDSKIVVCMSTLAVLQRRGISELKSIYEIWFQDLAWEKADGFGQKWLENRKQQLFLRHTWANWHVQNG